MVRYPRNRGPAALLPQLDIPQAIAVGYAQRVVLPGADGDMSYLIVSVFHGGNLGGRVVVDQ